MDYKQDRNTEWNPKDITRTIRTGQNQKDMYDLYDEPQEKDTHGLDP